MLQGITLGASEIFQVVPLLVFTVAGKFLDKTPRAKYNRWAALRSISWGDTYPKLTNLAVIGK
jgi:calcium permeable stress-gated cation channel